MAIGYSPLPARAGQHDSAARQVCESHMTLLLKERAHPRASSRRNRQLRGIVHLHQSSRNKEEKHGGEGDTNHPET